MGLRYSPKLERERCRDGQISLGYISMEPKTPRGGFPFSVMWVPSLSDNASSVFGPFAPNKMSIRAYFSAGLSYEWLVFLGDTVCIGIGQSSR